jgi:hypothetical protein
LSSRAAKRRRRREEALEAELIARAQEMCGTCAYRPGTDAYEARLGRPRDSRDTELQAAIQHCLASCQPFYCHEPIPEDAEGHRVPTLDAEGRMLPAESKLCVGYAAELRRVWRHDIPKRGTR